MIINTLSKSEVNRLIKKSQEYSEREIRKLKERIKNLEIRLSDLLFVGGGK